MPFIWMLELNIVLSEDSSYLIAVVNRTIMSTVCLQGPNVGNPTILRPAYFDVHESKGESLLKRGVYNAAGS